MGNSEVEYDVRSWPQDRLERLLGTLVRAGVDFQVQRGNLVVHQFYEPRVDALITSIEEAPSYDGPTFASSPPPPPPASPPGAPGYAPGTGGYLAPPGYLGHPGHPGVPATKPKVSGLAVASLVLGILWICGLGSLLAVVFGIVSLSQINRSEGRTRGTGLAIAGLVLGIVGLLLVVAGMIWGEDPTPVGPR